MLCGTKTRRNETSCLAPKGLESAGVRDKKDSTPLNHLFIVLCLQAVFSSQRYGKPQIRVPLVKEEREGRKGRGKGRKKEEGNFVRLKRGLVLG